MMCVTSLLFTGSRFRDRQLRHHCVASEGRRLHRRLVGGPSRDRYAQTGPVGDADLPVSRTVLDSSLVPARRNCSQLV